MSRFIHFEAECEGILRFWGSGNRLVILFFRLNKYLIGFLEVICFRGLWDML